MLSSRKFFLLWMLLSLYAASAFSQETILKYLSGTDKDHTVSWDFYCTAGRNSGKWTTIPVPSCWELQGFGTYNYGREKAEQQAGEQGIYRYHFRADRSWAGKQVNIVFEGSMTDTRVMINGRQAGPIHQGAFYRFKYDITPLLKLGADNLLEVTISKKSANASINRAERQGDFWIFGGIFRPVYLEVLPQAHIERLAVDATAAGKLSIRVFTANTGKGYTLEASPAEAGGGRRLAPVSTSLAADSATLQRQYAGVHLWSPEFPNLYRVKVNLKDAQGRVVHTVATQFGFRTAELRPHDGFYLNGKRVWFKGVDHHSFWPESGRTTSKAISIKDVALMKEMNMNAVRMSHYPPDVHFLDACDSMGLMVLDELTGWQHNYDDSTGHRLVREMVIRDVNHPGIVIWDNGNEGGFNRHLDGDFDRYDPQHRLVIHPWEKFNGTNTKHYPTYDYLQNLALYSNEVYFPTEFMHGLYDGGAGAGLEDYWNLIRRSPRSAGGFIWVFADEGIVRRDKNDSIDTHGNNAPDGILGPHREKEGSYYTIKEIWSPVHIDQPYIGPGFDGRLPVENRYTFTNLDQCSFRWKLVSFGGPSDRGVTPHTDAEGAVTTASAAPGEKKWLDLGLPASWASSDALYLTALDPHHREIFTWSWPLHSPADVMREATKPSAPSPVRMIPNADELIVEDGQVRIFFSRKSGYLEKVLRNDSLLSLSGGPALAGRDLPLQKLDYRTEGKNVVVAAAYRGKDSWLKTEWTFAPGMPAKLSYSFSQKGEADFMGITFDYPEGKIAGMRWLGRGPYHVWKNRLKGLQFGVWDKAYNPAVTGESWQYPEFKGNHSELYWVNIKTREWPFTVFTENRNLFLQMLHTPDPQGAGNRHTTVSYPEGNLGFMHAIQAIGTKFHEAADMGPQSQPNTELNAPGEGVLWFDFR
ncbi:glycoside hydrolase family 2 protein [Compostibacter hankyongensis]|uniref:beta-galactosidase n=1 Tax=Compostibacter hankyongensis TaxID=1007089 RepID=A0ABP8FXI2_9BACT